MGPIEELIANKSKTDMAIIITRGITGKELGLCNLSVYSSPPVFCPLPGPTTHSHDHDLKWIIGDGLVKCRLFEVQLLLAIFALGLDSLVTKEFLKIYARLTCFDSPY